MSGKIKRKRNRYVVKNLDGSDVQLIDEALMRVDCTVCDFFALTPMNLGVGRCWNCGSKTIASWKILRPCLIPEQEHNA